MKTNLPRFSLSQWPCAVLIVGLLAVSGPLQAAQNPPGQAPAQANAAPGSMCGGQPLCAETSDFVATIADFRTSQSRGVKVIDVAVHFQNKTNQPLILGYGEGSGLVLDDQGNRFGINGYAAGNGVQGIGRVNGNNIDPKFVLRPGSSGDTQFELAGAPGQVQGVSYELDLTFREITPLEGHQFAPAGEFPIRFRGLANGMFGTAPAAGGAAASGAAASADSSALAGSSASTACGPATGGSSIAGQDTSAAGQNLPAGANSTMASATNAVTTLRGLFGRKKAAAAAAAAPSATGAAPCVPAPDSGAATGTPTGSAPTSAASAAAPQTTTRTAAVKAPVTVTKGAPATAKVGRTATTTTATKPASQTTKKAVKKPATTPAPKKPAK